MPLNPETSRQYQKLIAITGSTLGKNPEVLGSFVDRIELFFAENLYPNLISSYSEILNPLSHSMLLPPSDS